MFHSLVLSGWERYQLQEWLAFINSEIHAGLALLFNESLPETGRNLFHEKIVKRFNYLEGVLKSQNYLMGAFYSIADAYLYTVTGWCRFFGIELTRWPALASYVERIGDRPAVRTAQESECI